MEKREDSDPILLELVKHALDAIVDEMAIALVRTAYSNNLKNSMDELRAMRRAGPTHRTRHDPAAASRVDPRRNGLHHAKIRRIGAPRRCHYPERSE